MTAFSASPVFQNDRTSLATWGPAASADTYLAAGVGQFVRAAVQVSGTFGGATVAVNGSLDGVTYFPLHDLQGNAISIATTAALKPIAEYVRFIKPSVSGGDGTQALTIVVAGFNGLS